jgi:hypothetical protein
MTSFSSICNGINNCPPINSFAPNNVKAFRIVKNVNLTDKDFKSYAELGQTAPRATAVQLCSISVYSSKAKAEHRLKINPYLGDKIACGILDNTAGKVSHPNQISGHFNWWAFDVIDRKIFFKVV